MVVCQSVLWGWRLLILIKVLIMLNLHIHYFRACFVFLFGETSYLALFFQLFLMLVALTVTLQSLYSHVTRCKTGLVKLATSLSIGRPSWYPIRELSGCGFFSGTRLTAFFQLLFHFEIQMFTLKLQCTDFSFNEF